MSTWLDDAIRQIPHPLQVRSGLQALPAVDRKRIAAPDPRGLVGSIDLDADMRRIPEHAAAPRWDYVIGYVDRAWFIEVHPAASQSNVDEVIAKARWLRNLLKMAPGLEARCAALVWIASGGTTRAPAFARRRRRLARVGVDGPRSRLRLEP